MSIALIVFCAAYLMGSVPFGVLIARLKGVDLFNVGSGNIGATNVGRALGRKFAALVFVLDFVKGAGPVAGAGLLDSNVPGLLPAVAGAGAFLGHLFPVYLRFRGGKGVATGAGVVSVLAPWPATAAVAAWAVAALTFRYVSLASLAAAGVLVAARFAGTPDPFGYEHAVVTGFCVGGAAVVAVKHRGNITRLFAGTESRIGDGPMRQTLLKVLHVLALGFWFGGAGFFSFVVAPTQNATFQEVVRAAPNDRTAFQPLGAKGETEAADTVLKTDLASALFGAAVGPVFPKFFAMQTGCCTIALVTAFAWWNTGPRVHRVRVWVLTAAALTLAVGWPVSKEVSALRLARFGPDGEMARAAFAGWHLVSLGLSAVTTLLAGVALILAAKLPDKPNV